MGRISARRSRQKLATVTEMETGRNLTIQSVTKKLFGHFVLGCVDGDETIEQHFTAGDMKKLAGLFGIKFTKGATDNFVGQTFHRMHRTITVGSENFAL